MLVGAMHPTRRIVILATLTLGSAVGCTGQDDRPAPPTPSSPEAAAQTAAAKAMPTRRPPAATALTTAPSAHRDTIAGAIAAGRKLLGPEDQPAADEVEAAINRVIPAEVREKRREPTDRERLALSYILFLTAATDGLNEGGFEAKQGKAVEVQAALDSGLAEFRKKHEGASPELREELAQVERVVRESATLHDFLNRPMTFPSEEESMRDLARRINQIPEVVDRAAVLERDREYHGKRFELLTEMEPLRAEAKQAGDGGEAAGKLAAQEELLAALDEQYRARVRLDELSRTSSRPSEPAQGVGSP
jgi:hypothetical protein